MAWRRSLTAARLPAAWRRASSTSPVPSPTCCAKGPSRSPSSSALRRPSRERSRVTAAPIVTMSFRALDREDPVVADLIRKEYKRQSETLELIASENLASPAVLEALGTLLTNKYAER